MSGELHVGEVVIPDHELAERFTRAGGPGGQNVNKRSTRVELIFDLSGSPSIPEGLRRRALRRLRSRLDAEGRLRVVAADERTQRDNREAARERMRALLEDAFRPPAPRRRPTAPTASARERRLVEKRQRAAVKRERRRPAVDD